MTDKDKTPAGERERVWPEGWQFSMSPWGYTVTVNRVELTETCVRYRCNFEGKCHFEVSLDPRDMIPDQARQMLRWHVDQSH